ncbi:MAG: HlyD family type I secretion periplasmic adaptor subunit [Acetobacterales bacterium]
MARQAADDSVDSDPVTFDTDAESREALETGIRGPILVGILIILLGIGGVVLWSAFAEVSSATIASGVVAPTGGRKTIQHLEGGIVRDILVENGDRVRAGQVLIRLDKTRALATVDVLESRYSTALAQEARLIAERDGLKEVPYPERISRRPDGARIIDAQDRVFLARRESIEGQIGILRQRIQEVHREIGGVQAERDAAYSQFQIIQEEIDGVRPLVEQGYARKPRLLALERGSAEIEGRVGRLTADIARAEQQIQEAELSIRQLSTEQLNQVVDEFRGVQQELSELNERLRAAQDVLDRHDIQAPMGGTVTGLLYQTSGAVIPAGGTVLEIVPDGEDMVVLARIRPEDIDNVRVGLPVRFRLTALSRRTSPTFHGKVAYLSPDQIVDPQNNRAYFDARVAIDPDSVRQAGPDQLRPGTPAEVEIITGDRTVMDYVLTPFTRALQRGLREQ